MNLEELIKTFIINYGLISVFILVMLEYANVPLPSEVVLPFIGVIGSINGINFFSILLVSVLGGIIGSLLNYFIGLYFGDKVINYVLFKFPKRKKSINSAYIFLEKYDNRAVFLSRLVPLARTFISIVAGVLKMKCIPFVLYSSIGITLWNALLIGLGFIFGENSTLINTILKRYSIGILVIVLIVAIIFLYKKREKIKSYLK